MGGHSDVELRLKVSRTRAEEVINRHLGEGQTLLIDADPVATSEDFSVWDERRDRWVKLTEQALKTLFSNDEPVNEFGMACSIPFVMGEENLVQEFNWKKEAVDQGNRTLRSLHERLEYIDSPDDAAQPSDTRPGTGSTEGKIFIVHGHDNRLKESVARLLDKTGDSNVTILHEQPNEGLTIIEKFEEHASTSDFAVVLLTGDDLGGPVGGDQSTQRPRGRQNVVFELGYFIGRISRSRVAVLYEEGVELPSDYAGVVYIKIDDGGWRYTLLRELQVAGLDFDLNKVPTP